MITVINGSGAPTAFDFPVDLDGAETLTLQADGSVLVTNAVGEVVFEVPAPWAYDANGDAVPAWHTITGDTLTLNVGHTATDAYPIIADPWWKPWTWNWGRIWNTIKRGGSVAVRHLKKCLGGAASLVIPTGVGVGSANVAAKKISGRVAIQVAGGPWVYVSIGIAGCVAEYF